MTRLALDDKHLLPTIHQKVAGPHSQRFQPVQAAIDTHPVVVVGMTGNPFLRKTFRALTSAGLAHEYPAFRCCASPCRQGKALKISVNGSIEGRPLVVGKRMNGAKDLLQRIAPGDLKRVLAP